MHERGNDEMKKTKPPAERRWFVRVGDHVDGPHPESRIRAWLEDGTLPRDLLLSSDARTWRRVKSPGSARRAG